MEKYRKTAKEKNPRAKIEALSFNMASAFLCQTFSHTIVLDMII